MVTSSTLVETWVGWPNGLASFLASTRKSPKMTFYGRLSSISLANNGLKDVTRLALAWVGWPNGEKNCSDFRANLILTKVSASHRKSSQEHARPGQTELQVDPSFQLRLLATPFGQGLRIFIWWMLWRELSSHDTRELLGELNRNVGIPRGAAERTSYSPLECSLNFLKCIITRWFLLAGNINQFS